MNESVRFSAGHFFWSRLRGIGHEEADLVVKSGGWLK